VPKLNSKKRSPPEKSPECLGQPKDMVLNRLAEIEGGEEAANGQASLFEGMSFWLSQNVPQKSRFRELVQVISPIL